MSFEGHIAEHSRNARHAWAMRHVNTLGAGASKRKYLKPAEKRAVVFSEWKRGTLHSGHNGIVPYPSGQKQAIAIALSESRK